MWVHSNRIYSSSGKVRVGLGGQVMSDRSRGRCYFSFVSFYQVIILHYTIQMLTCNNRFSLSSAYNSEYIDDVKVNNHTERGLVIKWKGEGRITMPLVIGVICKDIQSTTGVVSILLPAPWRPQAGFLSTSASVFGPDMPKGAVQYFILNTRL